MFQSTSVTVCTGLVAFALFLIVLWRLFPLALMRFLVFALTRLLYRVRVVGGTNIPREGGALLVPNHVSYLDWLFLTAAIDRPIRFLLETSYAEHWFLRPFVRKIGAIPVSRSGSARATLGALAQAREALQRGELVCIFAEGHISRIGVTLPFKRGIERVLRGQTAPIIPVHLDRVWGTALSRKRGRLVLKPPVRIPYPVVLSIGAPLPAGTSFQSVRNAVNELACEAWMMRKDDRRPLHRAFIRMARRRRFIFGMSDPMRGSLRRIMTLAGAIVLGTKLRAVWGEQRRVGILLPPSIAGALVNFAATIGGRATVNLNYTAGDAGIAEAIRQAGLETVVTSRLFLKKTGVALPDDVETIWLEEIARTVSRLDRIAGLTLAMLAPVRSLERRLGASKQPSVDDVVTIIFSSGSTGEPKGVELTHFNIGSNAEALVQVFQLQNDDKVLGILPLFHSFGYLLLWISAAFELGAVFLPNPLDSDAVGDTVKSDRVTLMLATPTFLQLYMRRCTAEQFESLRWVVVGAEKLPLRLAHAFEDKFGIRPLEGYGATECSPVIAVNVSDYADHRNRQVGSRLGSVGMPLPGVAVRTIDLDTDRPTDRGQAGMLWVRGPNVMRGYLGRDDLTREVIRDGWYRTGDIAIQDDRGFIIITDRLSRFSKIGGEMIPHGKVEEALHEASGREDRVFAVTGIPDERKGESLAVLHTLEPDEIPRILEALRGGDLPPIFLPRPNTFVRVDQLPILGTGKLDLRAVKRIARDKLT